MRYLQFLKEEKNIISKALSLPEPKIGQKYNSEKVERYLILLDKAIKAMTKKEENDSNDAIMLDLRDKKKKWEDVDKETKPVKTIPTEPPPEEQPEQQMENRLFNYFFE